MLYGAEHTSIWGTFGVIFNSDFSKDLVFCQGTIIPGPTSDVVEVASGMTCILELGSSGDRGHKQILAPVWAISNLACIPTAVVSHHYLLTPSQWHCYYSSITRAKPPVWTKWLCWRAEKNYSAGCKLQTPLLEDLPDLLTRLLILLVSTHWYH